MAEKVQYKVSQSVIDSAKVLAGMDKKMPNREFLNKARSSPKLAHLVKSVVQNGVLHAAVGTEIRRLDRNQKYRADISTADVARAQALGVALPAM